MVLIRTTPDTSGFVVAGLPRVKAGVIEAHKGRGHDWQLHESCPSLNLEQVRSASQNVDSPSVLFLCGLERHWLRVRDPSSLCDTNLCWEPRLLEECNVHYLSFLRCIPGKKLTVA